MKNKHVFRGVPIIGFVTEGIEISMKKFLAIMFFFSSTFAWFLSFYNHFDDIFSFFIEDVFWLDIGTLVFLFSVIFSALIGNMYIKKISRKTFLFCSTFLGFISSTILLFFNDATLAFFSFILIGSSFGLVMPIAQSYLTESTTPDERGRVSGFVVLSIFIFTLIASSASMLLGDENSLGILSVTIILKLTGFLPFLLDSIDDNEYKPKSWSEIFKSKDFGIYLLAYILFNVCSGLVSLYWAGRPPDAELAAANASATIVRYIGIAMIAIVTGFFVDKIGRKKPVILGVVLLGIAYAFVGLELTYVTFFLQMVISGLAWGILIVSYLIIPGDLAVPGSEERFCTAGLLIPFILYTGINGAGRFFILKNEFEQVSTLLSIVLFLSVIPILSAKETLSESKIQRLKMEEHIKKVKKVVKEGEK
jgi:MFS family permease